MRIVKFPEGDAIVTLNSHKEEFCFDNYEPLRGYLKKNKKVGKWWYFGRFRFFL